MARVTRETPYFTMSYSFGSHYSIRLSYRRTGQAF